MRDLLSYPVLGFTGLNGSGKTVLASVIARRRGLPIWSTTPGEGFNLLTAESELWALNDCTVILDEIPAILSSRQWQKRSAEVLGFLSQLRKRNVQVIWTGPTFEQVDVDLRRITWAICECQRLGGSGWERGWGLLGRLVIADRQVGLGLWLMKGLVREADIETKFIVRSLSTESKEKTTLVANTPLPACRRGLAEDVE